MIPFELGNEICGRNQIRRSWKFVAENKMNVVFSLEYQIIFHDGKLYKECLIYYEKFNSN